MEGHDELFEIIFGVVTLNWNTFEGGLTKDCGKVLKTTTSYNITQLLYRIQPIAKRGSSNYYFFFREWFVDILFPLFCNTVLHIPILFDIFIYLF